MHGGGAPSADRTCTDGAQTKRRRIFSFEILELFGPNISMNGILFNEYGLGLTLICFYTILAGLNKKNPAKKEFFPDSVLFLSFGLFGIFSYILNGTLYARPKILIPFLPLFILHCVRYLKSTETELD